MRRTSAPEIYNHFTDVNETQGGFQTSLIHNSFGDDGPSHTRHFHRCRKIKFYSSLRKL